VDQNAPHIEFEAAFQAMAANTPDEALLRICLNETWFSNVMAWLLDPSANHKLGKNFLKRFLMTVAKERAFPSKRSRQRARQKQHFYLQGVPHLRYRKRILEQLPRPRRPRRKQHFYVQGVPHLRYRKRKANARTVSKLQLGNATVHREFFLSRGLQQNTKSSQFCDIVVLDLDPDDGLFLVVENKLFSENHEGQLNTYLKRVESRYDRVPVRDYVYLTLRGDDPFPSAKEDDEQVFHPRWVRISWLSDVLPILESLIRDRAHNHPRVLELRDLLLWMKEIAPSAEKYGRKTLFAHRILTETARYLEAELNWLCDYQAENAASGRNWQVKPLRRKKSDLEEGEAPIARMALQFSSTQSQELVIELLPSYAVGLQSRYSKSQAKFEKLIVPFGAHSDQVLNLLDITARDIYGLVLAKPSVAVKQGRWKRGKARRKANPPASKPLFDFLHKRRFELRVLFGFAALDTKINARTGEY